MAKKEIQPKTDDNVADNTNDINEVANTGAPITAESENGESQTSQVSPQSDAPAGTDDNGDSKDSENSTELDITDETKGAGTQGADNTDTESEVNPKEPKNEPIDPSAPDESDEPANPAPTKSDALRAKIAAEVFKTNGRYTILYFTSDNLPFGVESDAVRHAGKLTDETIIPITKQ